MHVKHHSKETKREMSETRKRLYREGKIKHPKGMSGKIPWNKGKHHTEETKKKMAEKNRGQHRSLKTEFEKGHKPIAGFKKEHTPWNKGKQLSEKTKEKIREARRKQQIPTHNTKPELELKEIIEKNNLPFKYTGNGSYWIGDVHRGINPDFVNINGVKIAIDVFGRYWHSPLFGKKDIRYSQTYKGRTEIAKRYGWKLVIFWDDEINEKNVLERLINAKTSY